MISSNVTFDHVRGGGRLVSSSEQREMRSRERRGEREQVFLSKLVN